MLAPLLLAGLLAIAVGCGAETRAETRDVSRDRPPPCPVTKPNGVGPPGERPAENFLGNGRLFTGLYYPRLVATERNLQADGSIGEKFWWWADTDAPVDALEIRGRRLDGDARPLRARVSPGWPETEFTGTAFWAVGIIFPTGGCWEVTGEIGGAQGRTSVPDAWRLTFVVDVVPFDRRDKLDREHRP